jgi:hypothetical protein
MRFLCFFAALRYLLSRRFISRVPAASGIRVSGFFSPRCRAVAAGRPGLWSSDLGATSSTWPRSRAIHVLIDLALVLS